MFLAHIVTDCYFYDWLFCCFKFRCGIESDRMDDNEGVTTAMSCNYNGYFVFNKFGGLCNHNGISVIYHTIVWQFDLLSAMTDKVRGNT